KKYGYTFVYIHPTGAGYIEISQKTIDYDVDMLRKERNKLWRVLKVFRETGVNTDPQGRAISELNEVLEGINETLDQVDERGAIKRLKDIRYEFNPKYFDYSLAAESIFRKVMTCVSLETLSLSSIHIALDYSVDINSLQITDVKSRKE
ncbi:hypothetical protein CHH50_19145, partial [Terribacillus saccharophilus]